MALFDARPIAATYTDPKDPGTTLKFDVREEDFAALVSEYQGDRIAVASLPLLLKTLVDGGRASMGAQMGPIIGARLLATPQAKGCNMAVLMHMAVVCSDDPVRSLDERVLDHPSRYAKVIGTNAARAYVSFCSIVAVPSLPDSTDVNVRSDIPTLILSGGLDAQTPTFRSEEVKRTLSHARVVVLPDGTHAQLGAINLCAGKIMQAFVKDPNGALPLECVQTNRFPGLQMPEGQADTDRQPATR